MPFCSGARPRPSHAHDAGRWTRIVFLLMTALAGVTPFARSQVSDRISSLTPDEAIANAPVTIQANLRQGGTIERVYLLYRPFGESQFTPVQMDLSGNLASTTLPSRVTVQPFIEIYLVLVDRSGRSETYPLGETPDPLTTPPAHTLQLPVRSFDETDEQVVFLSPDRGNVLEADEVLISVSLLRADTMVVKRATQIFFDGMDVTSAAVFSGDLIVLAPENTGRSLAPGPHRVNVRLYDRNGNLYRVAALTFLVKGEVQYSTATPLLPGFTPNVSVYGESRNEQVGSIGTWYNRMGYTFSGKYGLWRFLSNGFLTSDEKSNRQPQNRFYAGVEHPLFRAGYGDAYPVLPDLILSGKRVRGAHGAARLGFFNLDVTYGSTVRSVEGVVTDTFPAESLGVHQLQHPGMTYGQLPDGSWGAVQYGTYQRELFAIRPSFGSGETWQLGFTWLKAKDDMSSIRYGVRPQENLVVGSDLVARFDGGRILFNAQGSFSALNIDISSGNISNELVGQLFPGDSSEVVKWRDRFSKLITVNEYLRPLSVDKPATLAYDLSLTLHYFDNVLNARYLFHGIDYVSLGATFVRRDVQGYSLTDRLRLAGNAWFLNIGYEHLQDNTIQTKVATTTYTTLSLAISYYPTGTPATFTGGYSRYRSENPLGLLGPDSLNAVDDVTNRFYLQSTYDVHLITRHTLGVRFSSSVRNDQTVRRLDVQNFSAGVSVTTRYAIPLETTLDASLNLNTLPVSGSRGATSSLDYTSLALQGRYELLRDVFACTAQLSGTFGDIGRTVFDVGGEWYALTAFRLSLEYAHFTNTGNPSEGFVSLRGRYEL